MKVKRVFSLALALVMAVGLFPVTAQAYDMGKVGQYQTISAGDNHFLSIKADGSLWGWGHNEYGQLGDGTTENRHSPVKVLDNVAAVSAGENRSMALKTDGTLWAWGYNDYGQLGDGTTEDRHSPVKVLDNVAAVSAGDGHSLAIQTDDSLWAWGANGYGQLGDGTTENRHSPVKVMDDVAAVSAGYEHSLALKTDGTLWAWGYNYFGQLGDATTTSHSTPVKVLDNVATVSGGGEHSLALKTDGSLWAWGWNAECQLGDGTVKDRSTPVKVLDNVAAASTGRHYSLAIKTDGSLWTWGDNQFGMLGDGTTTRRSTPVKVLDNVVAVRGGYLRSVALKTDGSLWAWGWNDDGLLGDGTTEDRNSPVKIMDNVKLPVIPTVTTTQTGLVEKHYPGTAQVVNTPSTWAEAEVSTARENGIVPSQLDGNYTGNITRAEFCKVAVALVESLGLKDSLFPYLDNDTYPSFSDTGDPDVLYMAKAGVVTGYGDGRFGPNDPITREQAAVMLTRLAHVVGMDTEVDMGPIYHDAADISSWAVDSVWFAATCATPEGKAVMGGTGNNCFSPKGSYTREQAFISFGRLYEAAKAPSAKPSGGGQTGHAPVRAEVWADADRGELDLAKSGKRLVDGLTRQSKAKNSGVDEEKLEKLKKTVYVTWPCGHAIHAREDVPDAVFQAFAQAILEGLEDSNIDELESDPVKLTNQIYDSIKGGFSNGSTTVTVGGTTYTVDYNISGMSFLGIGAQVSQATVTWDGHKALLVSTDDSEAMKEALSAFCSTLAELNKEAWKEFMAAYVADGFQLMGFKNVTQKNAKEFLDKAEKVILAMTDPDAANALLDLAGDELSAEVKKQLESGWLNNKFAQFIKDNVPYGQEIVEGADLYKKAKEKYEKWAQLVDTGVNGSDEEKAKALYSEFQSAMSELDSTLNAIP